MSLAILTRLLLLRLMFPREPSKHQADHRNVEHRLATLDGSFIIFRKTTIPIEPAKCSFYHPAVWEHFKTTVLVRTLDDFKRPLTVLFHPGN